MCIIFTSEIPSSKLQKEVKRWWPGLALQGDSFPNAGAVRIQLRWMLLVFLSNLSNTMDNGLLVFFLSNIVNDHFLFSTGNCSCINAASLQLRPQTNLLPFFLVPPLHSQVLSETTLNTELFCFQSILDRFFIPVILLFLMSSLFRRQPQIQAWSRIILGCQSLRTSQRWEYFSEKLVYYFLAGPVKKSTLYNPKNWFLTRRTVIMGWVSC